MTIKILLSLSNRILCEGVRHIVAQQLDDAQIGDVFSRPALKDPDLVLFDAHKDIDPLFASYPTARFICLDRGLKDSEIASLLLCHDISGIISPDLDLSLFGKALRKVHGGDVWLEQVHLKAMLKLGHKVAGQEDIRRLSSKDRKIIKLLARGLKNREIADQLCLSEPTVKAHLTRIYRLLNVQNRSQLVALATESGWQAELF